MNQIEITYLGDNGYVAVLPSAILVFDYSTDPTGSLQELLMKYPAIPVTFLITGIGDKTFPIEIFSMAETRQRTFIVSATVPHDAIDAQMPVSWLDTDNIMPEIPGEVSVTSKVDDGAIYASFTIASDEYGDILTYNGANGTLAVAHHKPIALSLPGESATLNL